MPSHPVHGKASAHPQYSGYRCMWRRCNDPKHRDYSRYGDKGVEVCARWAIGQRYAQGFWNYLEDLGERPGPGYTVDRIDGSKGYTPENCRWADQATQSANRRIVRGEAHYKARLMADDVRDIKVLLGQGKGLTEIGRIYGVTNCAIWGISKGRSWKHIT